MNSLVIKEASRFLVTVLALYSVFLFLRGHNSPGGGFIGGLVAASAWALLGVAFDPIVIRRLLPLSPRVIRALGLFTMIFSGMLGWFYSEPFLTGIWFELDVGETEPLPIGTPLLFDFGVYLLVFGSLTDMLRIFEEHS